MGLEEMIAGAASVLVENGVKYGLNAVGVLVLLLLAWFVAGFAKRTVLAALERARFDVTLSRFFANLIRYAILAFAVVSCLQRFGVETSSLAALVAAMGLAIGLAFQGSLSNFSSGVMLLIFRPFKVGTYVEVAGVEGTVEEIELFTSTLKTLDARRVILPNSSIFGATIVNYTFYEARRCDVPVGTVYSADVDETRKVLEAAIADIPGGLAEPAPQVYLDALGASSVDWQLRVYCDPTDYWGVREAMVRAAKTSLDDAGIGIPFPQMDVHVDEDLLKALHTRTAA